MSSKFCIPYGMRLRYIRTFLSLVAMTEIVTVGAKLRIISVRPTGRVIKYFQSQCGSWEGCVNVCVPFICFALDLTDVLDVLVWKCNDMLGLLVWI